MPTPATGGSRGHRRNPRGCSLIGLLWLLSATLSSGAAAAPPSVYLEALTWTEVRDALHSGYTTVIIPSGGTEQNGPHMVLGKHNRIVEHAAGAIARRLGDTLVAPVIAYVPEGPLDPPAGHMSFPGTITLPARIFAEVVEYAARSLRAHGFTDIVLIGDSGGNLDSLARVSTRLNRVWRDSDARVHFVPEYTRGARFRDWLLSRGETRRGIGAHAGIMDTSVALAVDPAMVRSERLRASDDFAATGVLGDPRRARADYGRKGLAMQIDAAVQRIRDMRAVP